MTTCSLQRQREQALPNIILITIDALRADHLSCYGYSYLTSPNIDAFAQKAVLFEYAYCPLPKTSASFASLMTGLHPFIHKTAPNRDSLKEKFVTLAEALKMKGYYNFAVIDNSNLSRKFGFGQGFDRYIGIWMEAKEKKDSAPLITKTILEFLKGNPPQPFFLWAHYIDPHNPYFPPEEFVEERPKGRIIQEVDKKVVIDPGKIVRDGLEEGYFISLYDGTIKFMDAEFKKIGDAFFEGGYGENSLLLLTSDHGEELGEHNLFFDHGPLTFSSSVRVPLIIYLPGEKGRRVRYPVSLMDIYPTLLDRVGLAPPYEIQGENLFVRPEDRYLLIKGMGETFSVIYEKYHLVRVNKKLSARLGLENVYLFDILQDPDEKTNLSGHKKELQRQMEERYREFFNHHGYIRGKEEAEDEPSLSEEELERLKTLGYIR